MIRIMFVCHGNICRSTMAEFLMKDKVSKLGESQEFIIESAGTSSEEYGSPVHYGTRRILDRLNIDCSKKRATVLKASDYDKYDYFIGMDERNRRNMQRIFFGDKENKVFCLMDYTKNPREVSDPYWTGNFEETYSDVKEGIDAFYNFLKNNF
ncbi:MAG: low molecular weight phosphotyrosine protein phosphatase [Clostridia bacterium]|nr:low molecular weight phosphotyrosine protein phosphatase [Clostridia bacterium]